MKAEDYGIKITFTDDLMDIPVCTKDRHFVVMGSCSCGIAALLAKRKEQEILDKITKVIDEEV